MEDAFEVDSAQPGTVVRAITELLEEPSGSRPSTWWQAGIDEAITAEQEGPTPYE
jgi:hypothetical protein